MMKEICSSDSTCNFVYNNNRNRIDRWQACQSVAYERDGENEALELTDGYTYLSNSGACGISDFGCYHSPQSKVNMVMPMHPEAESCVCAIDCAGDTVSPTTIAPTVTGETFAPTVAPTSGTNSADSASGSESDGSAGAVIGAVVAVIALSLCGTIVALKRRRDAAQRGHAGDSQGCATQNPMYDSPGSPGGNAIPKPECESANLELSL